MKWLFLVSLMLIGCAATNMPPSSGPVVFEVQPRQCPPLPLLADNATAAERTAFTRTVVLMYAQCANGG